MSCYFNDGKTAKSHSVSPVINGDYLTFSTQASVYEWPLADLRLVDLEHRKITLESDNETRLTLSEEIFYQLQQEATQLSAKAAQANSIKLIAKLAAAGIAISAIVFFGVPIAAIPLAKMTPKSFEIQLSKSVEAQLDVGLNFCKLDPRADAILQGLAGKLSKPAELDFPIKVGVMDISVPNAFAMPAGKIWFTSGLFDYAQNGDEVAAVLAHEIAHVENRDVLVSIYRAMGFGIILDAVIGGGSGAGQQLVLWGANLTDLKNSRTLETRADERGLELLKTANISSAGMASFFEKLAKLDKAIGLGEWAAFMSSHPDTGQRAIHAKKNAAQGQSAMSNDDFNHLRKVCD